MDEIGRSVQRVHDPAVGFVAICCRAFLRDEPGFGQEDSERSHDSFFRFFVYVRHVVVRVFLFYAFGAEVLPFFFQEASRIHCDTPDFGCEEF